GYSRMIVHPLLQDRTARNVAAVAVHEEDARESGAGETFEDVGDDALICVEAQADAAGITAEVRRDAIAEYGKHGHAERLRGFTSNALGQDRVDSQTQISVLLGAPHRHDGAAILLQLLFYLHPIHVRDFHLRCPGTLSHAECLRQGCSRLSKLAGKRDCPAMKVTAAWL